MAERYPCNERIYLTAIICLRLRRAELSYCEIDHIWEDFQTASLLNLSVSDSLVPSIALTTGAAFELLYWIICGGPNMGTDTMSDIPIRNVQRETFNS
jgi:hypothetical protein